MVDEAISLRQHDLDQVVRVERFTLLSACWFTGTPFSCELVIRCEGYFVNIKISPSKLGDSKLSDSAFPFFFHLQLAGADAGIEGEEICQQAVEADGFIDHGEMPGAIQINRVCHGGKRDIFIR